MKNAHLAMAALIGMMAAMAGPACATTVSADFSGPGVSGALVLTYGTATDAKYPNAYLLPQMNIVGLPPGNCGLTISG